MAYDQEDKVYDDVRCITIFLKSIKSCPELIIDWNKKTVTLNSRHEPTRIDRHKKSVMKSLYRFESKL